MKKNPLFIVNFIILFLFLTSQHNFITKVYSFYNPTVVGLSTAGTAPYGNSSLMEIMHILLILNQEQVR